MICAQIRWSKIECTWSLPKAFADILTWISGELHVFDGMDNLSVSSLKQKEREKKGLSSKLSEKTHEQQTGYFLLGAEHCAHS